MTTKYYPWPGDFTPCNPTGSVAAVLLSTDYIPSQTVAIYGHVKTENLGLEKIIANVISNPHIRYLVLIGKDIRGHLPGSSLKALHQHGIDHTHKINTAPGAIPYIENLSEDAIKRFQNQVDVIDLMHITDKNHLNIKINELIKTSPPRYGDPFIALRLSAIHSKPRDDKRALHSKIIIDWRGKITKRGS
jgi:tetrahydromethanopterin S-methyltransferase subunit A